ncbi:MAG: hypothetical protein KME18_06205 [Phormidium tanganyikae FI6-MK23]|jgi:L-asparaginase/Glu-tRNA(Gln) amidotransferase subunit D|nr:hypothetical protein [Phormidium tanganyikae FI6-MK23]
MMQGFVNQSCEAMIRVAVGHGNASKQMVEAVIKLVGRFAVPKAAQDIRTKTQ